MERSRQPLDLPMRGAMEPHVEQTGDGRVLMVMRSQLGSIHMSESTDEGKSWSEPRATELPAPESCPELARIPSTGDLLLIWNNAYDPKFRSHFGKRSPLTAAVSRDHGRTWEHIRDIETDPTRAFSNPGCRFTRDGKAIVNYWTCEYLPDGRMQCGDHLKQIALALHNWHEFHGRLPDSDSGSEPPRSWRVSLLPYLERADLFDRYEREQPWDAAANLPLARTEVSGLDEPRAGRRSGVRECVWDHGPCIPVRSA